MEKCWVNYIEREKGVEEEGWDAMNMNYGLKDNWIILGDSSISC